MSIVPKKLRKLAASLLVLVSGTIASEAWAACDENTSTCSETRIKSLLKDQTGNIYVGIGASMTPLSCTPSVATIDPVTGTQRRYLTIPSGASNRDMMHTLLKILHEQQRLVAKLKVSSAGACKIEEIHSEF